MIKDDNSVMRTAILTAFPKIFTDIEFSMEIFQQALQFASLYGFSFQPELFVAQMAVEIEARYKAVSGALMKQMRGGEKTLVIEIAAGLSPRSLQFDNVAYVECDLKPIIELKKRIFKNLNHPKETENFYGVDLSKPKLLKNFLSKIPNINSYEKVVVVSEGLFWYMQKADIEEMARVFLQILGKKMVWISADCPVKTMSESDYRKTISNSANSKRKTFENAAEFVEFFQDLGFEVSHKSLKNLVSPKKIKAGKIFSLNEDEVEKRIDTYTDVAVIKPKHFKSARMMGLK